MRTLFCLGLLCLLSLSSATCVAQSANATLIDSLIALSGSVCFNREGLSLANRLEELARVEGDLKALDRALECKACIYINEDMHSELQVFCDSVDSQTNLRERSPYAYFYIVYTRGMSFVRQGKYHLAINLAQQMYSYGKTQMEKDKDNVERYPRDIEIYVQGVDILANSYMEIGKSSVAMDYCTECRDLCLSANDGTSDISNNMLSSSYTRLCAATDIYEHSDGAKLLEYVDSFRSDLDLWASHYCDSVYVAAIEPYYRSSIEYISLVAYAQLGNRIMLEKSFRKFESLVAENGLATSMSINYYSAHIQFFTSVGNFAMAELYCDSLIDYYSGGDMDAGLMDAFRKKLELNHAQGRFEHDFSIAQNVLDLNDSINAFRLSSSLLEMSTLLGMDKLQLETQQLKARHQFMSLLFVIGALLSLLIIGGVWIWSRRQRDKERNKLLCEQNEKLESEVAKQTKELRQKNDDITASINYAKRIQTAMLPNVEVFAHGFVQGAFSFFKPCEIVSGDFYWTHREGNVLTFVCADCTGHGVPGGFLSMIGSTLLSEIFAKDPNLLPGEVLARLDSELVAALDKRGNASVQDGMDLALVSVNVDSMSVSFSAARRPVFLVHNNQLVEFKGAKRSIGDRDEVSRELSFVTSNISVVSGDSIYICSDGLADQFGGQSPDAPSGKRLKSGGLKRLLLETSALPICEQNEALALFFDNWKGSCYQVDDVSLIGIRI